MVGLENIMKSNTKLNQGNRDQFRAHFRALGLKRGESRVEVIRSAAQAMSIALTHTEHLFRDSSSDNQRAAIAFAAYRLLDPRERSDLYERVQLAFPIDREEAETPAVGLGRLVEQMPCVAVSKELNLENQVQLMKQPVIDEAIDGPGTEVNGEKVSHFSSSEPSLEEKRNVVRLLKGSHESTLQGLSPLGWIRSRLGI